jgi:phytoene desaturase
VNGETITSVLSGADYHTETLLRNFAYSEKWDSRVFSSSLLFYVGFDKKIENISHHALFLMWILSA